MAYEPPEDLVDLQVRFFTLDEECDRLDGDELAAARAERLDVVMRKHGHAWWGTVENRFEADMALRAIAKERMQPAAAG